ncbi:hypothetical protein EZ428_03075 [Pedobacter frigiditerrae]|uniref:Uncharacterized protein n=1 Tax=Pedobacter frigiditerrae TaxID=2530452 RepID=A0A4R0N1T0_9SPHI|nr:hypothetical protein [Pedobacter frigiditerrae]TCC93769.1 hypothetical protein EZ428_03075 [Pedobacter frigiditerrae]
MKYIVIIFSILLSVNTFGQVRKKIKPPVESDVKSNKFGRISNINFSTRIKKYPFNKAVQIQLVSFEDPTGGGQRDSTKKIIYNQNMPKSYFAVCINPFKEIKTLNYIQVDKLTDILFNYGPLGENHICSFGACYSPHNAILFLDENGKVFDFIEICFHCLHMYSFSKKLDVENECDHTINMISEFFKVSGIKYGVVDEVKK